MHIYVNGRNIEITEAIKAYVQVEQQSMQGRIELLKQEAQKMNLEPEKYAELYPEDADYERYPGTSSGL